MRPGLPTTTEKGGTSLVTTVRVAIMAPSQLILRA